MYQNGITAGEPKIINPKHVTFPITIAPDAPLGEHKFRIACTDGTTVLETFWVGQYPLVKETKEANNSPNEAQAIENNRTLTGITDREDVDYYKLHLKKSQTVTIEVEAMRLGKTFFDPFIAITDANGSELVSCDDSHLHRQDPYLSFTASKEGDYYILIRDSAYEGGGGHVYHMHVGDFPRPLSISPLGAQRGKAATFVSVLLGKSELKQTQTFSAEDEFQPLYITSGKYSSHTPYQIRVTDFGALTEKEPNDNVKHQNQATTPTAPIAFHGTVQQDGDKDWYRFHAKKGQKVRLQVYARELGSPLDSLIQIHDAKGKYIANNDDLAQNFPDSKLDYTVPADGDYWVVMQDRLKKGTPHHHYRIELTLQSPSIDASLANFSDRETQKWKAFSIPQGNRVVYQANVSKVITKEDIEVMAGKMPKGIKLRQIRMIDKDTKVLLYLEASADAPLRHSLYPLKVRTHDKKLTSNIISTTTQIRGPNNQIYYSTKDDLIPIQVTPSVQAKVHLIQPKMAINQSGILPLTIKIERSKGFDEPVTILVPWKPAGIGCPASITIPKGKDTGIVNLAADSNAKLGKWEFCVRATYNEKTGEYPGPVHISSNIINIEVAKPLLAGKLAIAATEQGVDTALICDFEKIEGAQKFSGKAKLIVQGLPDGITAQAVEITHDTKQIAIPVVVPANARTGKHGNLFCLAVVTIDGQEITQTLAQGGTLRVNTPSKPKVAVKTKNETVKAPPAEQKVVPKKPLSRLEQLRQDQ
ncbi:MAG: PPC domain-containing protein [Akkermansiaceae bacterium]